MFLLFFLLYFLVYKYKFLLILLLSLLNIFRIHFQCFILSIKLLSKLQNRQYLNEVYIQVLSVVLQLPDQLLVPYKVVPAIDHFTFHHKPLQLLLTYHGLYGLYLQEYSSVYQSLQLFVFVVFVKACDALDKFQHIKALCFNVGI